MIILPFPPSLNSYYRTVSGRILISKKGRMYRKLVNNTIMWQNAGGYGAERLAIEIHVYPPDKRRRDLDNMLKGLLDAMQDAGLYEDDSQIDDLRIIRCKQDGDARVEVRIEAL